MTPREWTGCVVGVRSLAAAGCVGTHSGCVTIRRAWRRRRDGVLTRVDVDKTLHEKLGVDFRRYTILGACNPKLAHAALSALEAKRPEGILAGSDEDPLAVALADLETLAEAYRAVLERLDVICVRRSAQATLDEVADAAGALSGRSEARRSDEGAIQELAAELAHAESAMALATPEEGESRALAAALARSTAALGRNDGASLDELLKALKSIA